LREWLDATSIVQRGRRAGGDVPTEDDNDLISVVSSTVRKLEDISFPDAIFG